MPWRALGLLLLALLVWSGNTRADWKTPREALDRRLASADFQIYYSLTGEHAFASDSAAGATRATAAEQRLTTLVEQLATADRLYRETLQLRPLFAGGRHAAGRGIDIHILNLEGKNGSTGDELHTFRYRHFAPRANVLAVALSRHWRPPNLTPAHELFHAYQYGYTFFKNAWYLEGMARASEGLLRTRRTVALRLPDSLAALDTLLQQSYSAGRFWNRLIELCGPDFLSPLLTSYDRLDDLAARERGIPQDAWPEREQWAAANNPYLLRGLNETLTAPYCISVAGQEISAFKGLIDAWLQRATPAAQ